MFTNVTETLDFEEYCYRLVVSNNTVFMDAELDCQTMNSSLASIHSLEESNTIRRCKYKLTIKNYL